MERQRKEQQERERQEMERQRKEQQERKRQEMERQERECQEMERQRMEQQERGRQKKNEEQGKTNQTNIELSIMENNKIDEISENINKIDIDNIKTDDNIDINDVKDLLNDIKDNMKQKGGENEADPKTKFKRNIKLITKFINPLNRFLIISQVSTDIKKIRRGEKITINMLNNFKEYNDLLKLLKRINSYSNSSDTQDLPKSNIHNQIHYDQEIYNQENKKIIQHKVYDKELNELSNIVITRYMLH
jgi:hypothetical protein